MEELKFGERNVRFNVEASNWEDAIRKGVEILEKNGYVQSSYVEHIIKNVKEFGPYIIIAKGIAIPHARPEDGAIDNGYSLITLKNPVYFPKSDKSVKVLISFSAIDDTSHLELIKMIVKIIETDLIYKLSKVQTVSELKQVLSNSKL